MVPQAWDVVDPGTLSRRRKAAVGKGQRAERGNDFCHSKTFKNRSDR